MLVGRDGVINREQVRQAKTAGAGFVVSLRSGTNTVQACQQIIIPIVRGSTTSAVGRRLTGYRFCEILPSRAVRRIPMIKAMLAPYHQLQVMPTGGIRLNNIPRHLAIPQIVAAAVRGWFRLRLSKPKDWAAIGKNWRVKPGEVCEISFYRSGSRSLLSAAVLSVFSCL